LNHALRVLVEIEGGDVIVRARVVGEAVVPQLIF
jgi:hypothetical protein